MPIQTPEPPVTRFHKSADGVAAPDGAYCLWSDAEAVVAWHRDMALRFAEDRDSFKHENRRLEALLLQRAQEIAELKAAYDETSVLLSRCNDELTARAQEIEQVKAELAAKHDYACRMDALAEERAIEITRLKADAALVSRAPQQEQVRVRGLCSVCGGNGVVKIPGGVSVCDHCHGDCWEPQPAAPLPASAALQDAEVEAIRARLLKRQEQQPMTCQACGQQQPYPWSVTMCSQMATDMWRCQRCGGQMTATFTIDSGRPTPDDDLQTLLDRLAAALSRADQP